MVASIDIYRSAKALIDRHGEAASIIAAQRADELLARGDMDGKLTWLAILRAIEELNRTERDRGEAVT